MEIVIDGARFSDLEGFYDEMERLLTRDLSWPVGRNLDAFHDLLRGGFGVYEYGERVNFRWINAGKSRRALGYEETRRHWERCAEKCHPTNRANVLRKAAAAGNCQGPTLFDLIVEDILDKGSVYDHTLVLEE